MNFYTHLASESTIVGHKPSHTIISAFALAAAFTAIKEKFTQLKGDEIQQPPPTPNACYILSCIMKKFSPNQIRSEDECLNFLAQAQKKMDEEKTLGDRCWDFLTSAVPVFGIRIPGWLIAAMAALTAKYFAWSIALCLILFVMVQCLISVEETNANMKFIGRLGLKQRSDDLGLSKRLYQNRVIGSLTIPGWLIAGLIAYVVLCFSGTIVNGILAGLLCWIIWSVWQTKTMNDIIADFKNSVGANDESNDNVVRFITELCNEQKISIAEMLKKYNPTNTD